MKNFNCIYAFAPTPGKNVDEVAALINGELQRILQRYAAEGLIDDDYSFDCQEEVFGNLVIPEDAVPVTLDFDDIFVPKSEHF